MYVKKYVREQEKKVEWIKNVHLEFKNSLVLSPSSCETLLLGRIGNEDYSTEVGNYALVMGWSSGERCCFILLSKWYRTLVSMGCIYTVHLHCVKNFGLESVVTGTVTFNDLWR